MEPLSIVLKIDGADQVDAGAKKAGDALTRFGVAGQKAGQQVQLSGQQMAAVSTQLQDLFIQIQGGQAPLTALLQQGSQLSQQFGGFGNAVRAVGSLLTPARVAIGGLAAAAAGIGAAIAQASDAQREFAKALTLSGNAAGVTVGQLAAMARAVRESGAGTQGRASEVLQIIAASGVAASSSLEKFTEAALRMERVGGPAAEETAKAFIELGRAPLEASVKLNETMNYLTAATVRQVSELIAVGKNTDAARVAQEAYFNAVATRAPEMAKHLGLVETAWNKVAESSTKAWDDFVNNFRPAVIDARIKEMAQSAGALQRIMQVISGTAPAQSLLGLSSAGNLGQDRSASEQAAASAKRAAAAKAEIEVQKILAQYADDNVKRLQEETRIRETMLVAGRTQAEIEKVIAQVREKYADKSASRGLEQEATLLERLNGLSGTYQKDLAALDQMRRKGLVTEEAYVELVEKLIESQPAIAAAQRAELEASKAVAEARISARRAEQQGIDDVIKQAREQTEQLLAGIKERTRALQDENAAAVIARTQNISLAEAINVVTQQRLSDKAAALAQGSEAEQTLRREIALRKELSDAQSLKELNDFLDPNRAQTFGQALSGAFEAAGSSLAKMSSTLQEYARSQRDIVVNAQRLELEKDPAEKARKALLLQNRAQEASIALYANMAGAAKGFFNEGTRGYKALEAAETAFRVVQLASDLQKGLSAAAVGVATQAQGDPYTAFPRMAAMAAAMAALGFAVGGFGGGGSSGGGDGTKQSDGKGTVLGDVSAVSASISRSTEQLASTARLQLTTQSGMLDALRSIQNSIGGLAGLVLRGNTLDSSSVQQGTTLSLADPISRAIFGKVGDSVTAKIYASLFGKKVSVTGQGLAFDATSLQQAAAGGLNVSNYTDVNSKQKVFGITVSNKNRTEYSPVDSQLSQQFNQVFKDLYAGIISASAPLGVALDTVKGRLNSFVVDIGKIDLQGLNGQQIQEKLTAVIGATADNIGQAALPGLQAFQKVGEGYFETIVRVASGVETAQDALARLGVSAVSFGDIARKQGDVAAEIVRQSIVQAETTVNNALKLFDGDIILPRLSSVGSLIATLDGSAEDLASAYKSLVNVRDVMVSVGLSGDSLTAKLLQGAGSLDDLASSLDAYLQGGFFTDQERAAAAMSQLQAEFARLGVQTPQSYAQFRQLVEGIDVSTEAGQRLRGQILGLAGEFDSAQKAAERAGTAVVAAASRLPDILKSQAGERDGLLVEILRAQGDTAGAAALKRQQDLAALTAGLSAHDAAAATAGYDYIASLRAQITALNDASQAAKAAAAAEAQRAEAAARERDGIQARIDELLGNTTALRARELAGLDETNRALQEHYYALLDQKTATESAAQAAQDLAAKQAAVASERDGIQARIDDLLGNTTALRARELAGLDESNRALQEHYYALIDQKAATEAAAQAAQDLANKQAAVVSERDGIQARIDELLGNTTALRARELAGLDESNRALQEHYYALMDAKTAQDAANRAAEEAARTAQQQADAAERLRDAWRQVGQTLREEAERILGFGGNDSRLTLAQAQQRFATSTAQARAGDQDAAKLLPQLGRTLVELVQDTAGSRAELERVRAQVAASLQGTAGALAGKYGFSYQGGRPVDVQSLLRDVAAAAPPAAATGAPLQTFAALQESNASLVQEVRALRAEVQALREPAERTAAATVATKDTLTLVTDNGRAMQVEDAS